MCTCLCLTPLPTLEEGGIEQKGVDLVWWSMFEAMSPPLMEESTGTSFHMRTLWLGGGCELVLRRLIMCVDSQMISLLLKYGADITLCNNEGYSVLDLAPDNLRRILLGEHAHSSSHEGGLCLRWLIGTLRYFRSWHSNLWSHLNPFTPESDQCQISPAASQEIWHHTVRRTWLFIAYSDERCF